MKRKPTIVFSEWAESGRDEKMASGHKVAVGNMLEFALKYRKEFSFIDAGCGNGWVVRRVRSIKNCYNACGVDGAQMMISKALKIDPKGNYIHTDLGSWRPKEKVDIVHSMEVVYYLTNPKEFIRNVYTSWLNDGGRIIIGLDFYEENTVSHSWPEDCGVSIMSLLSEKQWIDFFTSAGFREIESWRVDKKTNWAGTLVITGLK
jgi:cyclopropane fatty-acyl-phospholipid synthase-like methyltransferase